MNYRKYVNPIDHYRIDEYPAQTKNQKMDHELRDVFVGFAAVALAIIATIIAVAL